MRIAPSLLVSLVLGSFALPAGAEDAILRCDPGSIIKTVDGDKSLRNANVFGDHDCAIRLSAGAHTVSVAYQWSASDFMFNYYDHSPADIDVAIDAKPDRIYRIKIKMGDPWAAWVVDVTADEAGLPTHPSPKRADFKHLSKAERQVTLVMRIAPSDVVLAVRDGSTEGIWFRGGYGQSAYYSEDESEFAIRTANVGENISMLYAATGAKRWGTKDKYLSPACGETRVPVFENLPAGKVLYLGHYDFEVLPPALRMTFTQDGMAEAREYLRQHRPELADQLELASYRMVRLARPCPPGGTATLQNSTAVEQPSR